MILCHFYHIIKNHLIYIDHIFGMLISIMKKELRLKAIELRKIGHSVKELHHEIGVSKSTISRWIQNIVLSQKAQKRLTDRSTKARIKAELTIREKTRQKKIEANNFAAGMINSCCIDDSLKAIVCSMIYFCEGAKSLDTVCFINSDPGMIALFLSLLRNSFDLDEKKLRVLMQLHDYHDEKLQRKYWSSITRIPENQFNKTYFKISDHRYKKEGYQGCIMVRYHDASIARKINAIAKTFMERYK